MLLSLCLYILVSTVFVASAEHPKLKRAPGDRKVNGYIIKLKDGAPRADSIATFTGLLGDPGSVCEPGHTQWTVINGYSAHLSDVCLQRVLAHPDVEYVEEDGIVSIKHVRSPHAHSRAPNHVSRDANLNRCGNGTNFYGIDTGILITHDAFTNRAFWGATFGNYTDTDDNGHGTHTAGIAAGVGYGPATCSTLYAVKVLSGSGEGVISDIISGINWSVNHAMNSRRPSVVNMSLGGSAAQSLDDAVKSGIDKGVHFTIAAGNSNKPAENYSPARVDGAVTVGAVDTQNNKACFSNYGSKLVVWDQGVDIVSAWNTGNNSTETLSGTSMAAPAVNGKLLVALSNSKPEDTTPADLIQELKDHALNKVKCNRVPCLLDLGLIPPTAGGCDLQKSTKLLAQLW